MRAASSSIELRPAISSSEQRQSPHGFVQLLSVQDRLKASKIISKLFSVDSISQTSTPKNVTPKRDSSSASSRLTPVGSHGKEKDDTGRRRSEGGKNPLKRSRTSESTQSQLSQSSTKSEKKRSLDGSKNDNNVSPHHSQRKGREVSPKRSKKGEDGNTKDFVSTSHIHSNSSNNNKKRDSTEGNPHHHKRDSSAHETVILNGSPANHVTSLLFTNLIQVNEYSSSTSTSACTSQKRKNKREKNFWIFICMRLT
jgi:hypothetical protein